MRTHPRAACLDFAAPVRRSMLSGVALCLAGLVAATWSGLSFRRALAERGRLEAEIAGLAQPRSRPPSAEAIKAAAESALVERELEVPWTRLLAELEEAAHDVKGRVSVLRIEPDPGKHLVRITAEVRVLEDALDFLERLQASAVLRHPMLVSHERRKDDAEHPLRIMLSAEWGT